MKDFIETKKITWEKEVDGIKTLICLTQSKKNEGSSYHSFYNITVSGPSTQDGKNEVHLSALTITEALILAESASDFIKENLPALAT